MMKVFCVVTERDGEITKEPGRMAVEIEKNQYRYAADTIEQVWDEIAGFRDEHSEEMIVAVYEEHPAVIVLESADLEGK